MSKKSFITILILSVVLTYFIAVMDSLRRGSLLAGTIGVPFRFGSASLFGEAHTDYWMLLLNIVIYFFVLLGLRIFIKRSLKR